MHPSMTSLLNQFRSNILGAAGAVAGVVALVVALVLGVLGNTGQLGSSEKNEPFEGATRIQLTSDEKIDFTTCTITEGGPAEERVHRFDADGTYYADLTNIPAGEHTINVTCAQPDLSSTKADLTGTATFTAPTEEAITIKVA